MPMIAIMARRPLASSEASLRFTTSSSSEVITLKPKSPAAPGVPGDWS
eukprot:CAMPEP_0178424618 /NCGR_PEP_ID=MMETSP0689_2-20121128/28301_1 /TAXON_ID=160604 /ORGANISM="Amphidinium massartii, Strain CS-259" /LENGTH=47 /DNA_ID= /DNA_START= /DNA_END= /DNA_ORIENTATION=